MRGLYEMSLQGREGKGREGKGREGKGRAGQDEAIQVTIKVK